MVCLRVLYVGIFKLCVIISVSAFYALCVLVLVAFSSLVFLFFSAFPPFPFWRFLRAVPPFPLSVSALMFVCFPYHSNSPSLYGSGRGFLSSVFLLVLSAHSYTPSVLEFVYFVDVVFSGVV